MELEITWDGTVPGLEQRRLSIEAFGPALRQLSATIRRIASDLEAEATGSTDRPTGRLTRGASNLDVQIESIQANSPLTLKAVAASR